MISRNLSIALLVSIGVHVLGMSAVTIINPDIPGRGQPYTRVDFLGPLLGKTAFDIMIENSDGLKIYKLRIGVINCYPNGPQLG